MLGASDRSSDPPALNFPPYDLRSFRSPVKPLSGGSPKIKHEADALLSPLHEHTLFPAPSSPVSLKWSPRKDEVQCCCCEAGCDEVSCCEDCSECEDDSGLLTSNDVPKPGSGGGGGSPAGRPHTRSTENSFYSPNSLRSRRSESKDPGTPYLGSPYNTRRASRRLHHEAHPAYGYENPAGWINNTGVALPHAPHLNLADQSEHGYPSSEVKSAFWAPPYHPSDLNEVFNMVLRNPLPPEHFSKRETSNHDSHTEFKPCHCKKSKCLKLYCECFARNAYCTPQCACCGCYNVVQHEDMREVAIKGSLDRDPQAFFRGKTKEASDVQKQDNMAAEKRKGCKCKKSECLKKYCECYQAGAWCGPDCKCVDCRNVPSDPSEEPGNPKKAKVRKQAPFFEPIAAAPEYEPLSMPQQDHLPLDLMGFSALEFMRKHLQACSPDLPPPLEFTALFNASQQR